MPLGSTVAAETAARVTSLSPTNVAQTDPPWVFYRGMSGRTTCPAMIRVFGASEWRLYRRLRLRALEDSPEAFGSTVANARARPDSFWQERLRSGTTSGYDQPLCAHVKGEGVGLAWGSAGPPNLENAHLFQMWVASERRSEGIGRALLEAVISWARSSGAEFLHLGVTCGNSAAAHLYRQAGFSSLGEPEPLRPGSQLLAQRMALRLTPHRR